MEKKAFYINTSEILSFKTKSFSSKLAKFFAFLSSKSLITSSASKLFFKSCFSKDKIKFSFSNVLNRKLILFLCVLAYVIIGDYSPLFWGVMIYFLRFFPKFFLHILRFFGLILHSNSLILLISSLLGFLFLLFLIHIVLFFSHFVVRDIFVLSIIF